MKSLKTYRLAFIIISVLLLFCFLLNISLGSVSIPMKEIIHTVLGQEVEKESWNYIILHYRIPKAITAILTGCSLSISGLLMQTLFRNPLAGPFVLGISSGASLGVALFIMGGSLLTGVAASLIVGQLSIAIAATLGSFVVLLAIVIVASKVRDTMALLIIGLMFGSITAAVVSVLSYFTNKEKLQQYIFWSFGNLGNLSWDQIILLTTLVLVGLILAVISIKSLNSLLLGENYARSLGTHIQKSRYLIIVATSILAGSVTAYVGPIAFIGLAVPHLTRQIFNTPNHHVLVPATAIYGGILMLICDTIAQLPGSEHSLPINAITSIVGAPVVIWLLVRKRKMVF
ncbi:iron ABC transporter permease [Galbibacter sp. EGI 63066]|uniref:FecCD family ABC transporter permease n=1 Tax=Galbibacter sp. EGI 63066 TaxID=2993559 RepID=UPI00224887BD|nr:iron ABC transporter permease [Galbibacter sp. EGI 63066]MCX2678522.1 iron ABC transporter permease [Galbibacter sp. EGI 63066]